MSHRHCVSRVRYLLGALQGPCDAAVVVITGVLWLSPVTSQVRSDESYSDNKVQKSNLPGDTQGYRVANPETGTN